ASLHHHPDRRPVPAQPRSTGNTAGQSDAPRQQGLTHAPLSVAVSEPRCHAAAAAMLGPETTTTRLLSAPSSRQRRSLRRARGGQGPVLAILAMLAIERCAWLRVAPLLP